MRNAQGSLPILCLGLWILIYGQAIFKNLEIKKKNVVPHYFA